MKKLLLAIALFLASFTVVAADNTDLFDEFVKGMSASSAEGGFVIRSDKEHRIVFMDYKMPAEQKEVSPQDLAEAKAAMIKEMGESGKVVKALNISILINFITTDGRIFTVVIMPQDL